MHNPSPASKQSRATLTKERGDNKGNPPERALHIPEQTGATMRSGKRDNELMLPALASRRTPVQTHGSSAGIATVTAREGHKVPQKLLSHAVALSSSPRLPNGLQSTARKTSREYCEGMSSVSRTLPQARTVVSRINNMPRAFNNEARPKLCSMQIPALEQVTQARWGFSSCLQSSPQQAKPDQRVTQAPSVTVDLQLHSPRGGNLPVLTTLRPALWESPCLVNDSRQLSLTPRTMAIKSTALRLPQEKPATSRGGLSLSSPRQYAPWNAASMSARSSRASPRSLSTLANPQNWHRSSQNWHRSSMSAAPSKSVSSRPQQNAFPQPTSQARQTFAPAVRNMAPLSTAPQEALGPRRKRSSVTTQLDHVPPGIRPIPHMIQQRVTRLQTTPASQLQSLVSIATKGGLLASSKSLPASPRHGTTNVVIMPPSSRQPFRTMVPIKTNMGSTTETCLKNMPSCQKGTTTSCCPPPCSQHIRDLGSGCAINTFPSPFMYGSKMERR